MKSLSNALKRKNKETRPASIVSIVDVAASFNVSKPFTIGTLIKLLEPDVLTQHNSNDRNGVYMQLGLNQSSFSGSNRWGLIQEIPVEGAVYAQILYREGLQIGDEPWNIRNVIFVATARNKIYAFAFDSASNTFYLAWKREFDPPDDSDMRTPFDKGYDKKHPLKRNPCSTMSPIDPLTNPPLLGIGIQSTPVIDRPKNRMYVCFKTNDGSFAGSDSHQYLASIDISSGHLLKKEEIIQPLLYLDIKWQRNRSSLLLVNDIIYVALGSHCEEIKHEYNGWILAYDANSLKQVGFLTITDIADPDEGGIWQASNGLLADDESIFLITGNGRTDYAPENDPPKNLGNSFVRIDPVVSRNADGSISEVKLKVKDWFTPYRQSWSNDIDLDLGSAGPIFIPGTDLVVGGGKQGIIYVLNRNKMGGIDSYDAYKWDQLFLADGCRGPAPNLEIGACVKDKDATQYPEDPKADVVVQKFQAAINQYVGQVSIINAWPVQPLSMREWWDWPHIHGSPIYHNFNNGRSMMYVWPEKDFLKVYELKGNSSSRESNERYRFLPAGQSVIRAPNGMPGGMLSLSIDPSMAGGGVVFASVPTSSLRPYFPYSPPDDAVNDYGILRAFDPMTLEELWNNDRNPDYLFAKFCPPTIADGKVLVPTFSNKVLVYGPLS